VWTLLRDRRSKNALFMAQLFADQMCSRSDLEAAHDAAYDAAEDAAWVGDAASLARGPLAVGRAEAARAAAGVAVTTLEVEIIAEISRMVIQAAGMLLTAKSLAEENGIVAGWQFASLPSAIADDYRGKMRARQEAILKDLMAPSINLPVVPIHVRGLANYIYDGDYGLYPVLADALNDLDLKVMADHCRQPDHWRGCWVIDALRR
jgi:hypothetical protein